MINSNKNLDKQITDTFHAARIQYFLTRSKNTRQIQRLESEALKIAKKCEKQGDENRLFEFIEAHRDHPGLVVWDDCQKGVSQILKKHGVDYYKYHGPHTRGKKRSPTIYLSPGDLVRDKEDPCYWKYITLQESAFLDKERAVYTPDLPIGEQKKRTKAAKKIIAPPPHKMVKCPICGVEYPATRSTRKYCNKSACRQAASRAARAAKKEND